MVSASLNLMLQEYTYFSVILRVISKIQGYQFSSGYCSSVTQQAVLYQSHLKCEVSGPVVL